MSELNSPINWQQDQGVWVPPDFHDDSLENDSKIETEERESDQADVLFFSSPVRSTSLPREKTIQFAENEGQIPNGIWHIASYLEANDIGAAVVPLDPHARRQDNFDENEPMKALYRTVDQQVEKHNPNLLCFEMMYTFNSESVLALTRWAKTRYPDKLVVVGGAHANSVPMSDLLNSDTGIDVVVLGEGEEVMRQLATVAQSGDRKDFRYVSGIAYIGENGEPVVQSGERFDLQQMSPLSRDVVDLPEGISLADFSHAVMSTRGCLGRCLFCVSPRRYKRELTHKREEVFETDIRTILQEGATGISVWDDDILADLDNFRTVMSVLTRVHAEYPEVKFFVEARADHFSDKETAAEYTKLMREAGVTRIFLGIESMSQAVLDGMLKGTNVESIKPACQNLKESGLEIGAFVIVGHPGSNPEEEEKSLQGFEDLLKDGLIDDMQVHVASPMPGTSLSQSNRIEILDSDPSHYGIMYNYPVFQLVDPKNIDPETNKPRVIMTQDEIWNFFLRYMELRQKYLGLEPGQSNKERT